MRRTSPPTAAPLTDRAPAASAGPSRHEFVAMLAMTMSMTALAIDVMLPAFPDIREAMGLAAGSPDVGRLVTVFFLGLAVAQIPAGILSDHFGRKPILYVGLGLYALGAVATLLAPTLGWMLVARFAWGVGAGLPRVQAIAIVRDRYSGNDMARLMSLVMSMFLLVPVIAPSIGALLLLVGPWQLVFGFCAVAALALGVWLRRLPESLPPERRRPLRVGPVVDGARLVVRSRTTVLLGIAMTAAMGTLTAYIATSELLITETLGLEGWFPIVFGAMALGMGVASYVNSRLVHRFGMWPVLAKALVSYLGLGTLLLVVTLATDGVPPTPLALGLLALLLANHSLLIPTMNSAAMEPVGAAAGTASALLGAFTVAGGALVGAFVDRRFDGTMRALAWSFAVSGVVALVCFRLARRRITRPPDPAPTELDVPAA